MEPGPSTAEGEPRRKVVRGTPSGAARDEGVDAEVALLQFLGRLEQGGDNQDRLQAVQHANSNSQLVTQPHFPSR
jgi:hypothetical protein